MTIYMPLHTQCPHTYTWYLVRLDNNEDVVDADSQHQEGDDLDDDEGERDASIAEDAQRTGH